MTATLEQAVEFLNNVLRESDHDTKYLTEMAQRAGLLNAGISISTNGTFSLAKKKLGIGSYVAGPLGPGKPWYWTLNPAGRKIYHRDHDKWQRNRDKGMAQQTLPLTANQTPEKPKPSYNDLTPDRLYDVGTRIEGRRLAQWIVNRVDVRIALPVTDRQAPFSLTEHEYQTPASPEPVAVSNEPADSAKRKHRRKVDSAPKVPPLEVAELALETYRHIGVPLKEVQRCFREHRHTPDSASHYLTILGKEKKAVNIGKGLWASTKRMAGTAYVTDSGNGSNGAPQQA